jgi:hypothetical protein
MTSSTFGYINRVMDNNSGAQGTCEGSVSPDCTDGTWFVVVWDGKKEPTLVNAATHNLLFKEPGGRWRAKP